jgi:alpha-1,3/alpha-1,6-mannosyltransferase
MDFLWTVQVVLYTGYHNATRCFEETLDRGRRRVSWIKVHGAWMPRQISGHFHAPFAYARALWTAAALLLIERDIDAIIVDQVSAPLVLLRLFSSIKIVFYCHYPDMLLAKRDSWSRRLYRSPLDLLEQLTTGMAHKILVNSEYTRKTFARTFKPLYRIGLHPAILYPAVGRQVV